MLGTGLRISGTREEGRFYIPVKTKKSHNHQQRQAKQQRDNEGSDSVVKSKVSGNESLSSIKESVGASCNLERFLEFTTPSVPAQYFSKTTMRGWKTCDVEYEPYFTLADLWESFKEWSAYGAGVPLVLEGNESIVQYYVPYLSGIQLYAESTTSAAKSSDCDSYKDSSSDGSSDYEYEKSLKFTVQQSGHNHLKNGISSRMGKLSVSDEQSTTQEGFSSDDSETGNSHGRLLFEFLEQDSPYGREPLADKIYDLARQYPELNTLRSCDLMPLSWICVAWYPIYRIPTGPTLKVLDACFLTYHSLSTPTRGGANIPSPAVIYSSEMDGVPRISLPVFGMASYKVKGSMWTQNGVSEHQLSNSLMQAADNWLRLLRVDHPDFQFFASHGVYLR